MWPKIVVWDRAPVGQAYHVAKNDLGFVILLPAPQILGLQECLTRICGVVKGLRTRIWVTIHSCFTLGFTCTSPCQQWVEQSWIKPPLYSQGELGLYQHFSQTSFWASQSSFSTFYSNVSKFGSSLKLCISDKVLPRAARALFHSPFCSMSRLRDCISWLQNRFLR